MGKLIPIILSGLLALTSSSINCTSSFISFKEKTILNKEIKYKTYVGLIEGLQPWSGYRMKELGNRLSSDLEIATCTTSGNPSTHVEFAREANKNKQKVIIIGYSLGESQARVVARQCEREGIDIELLVLLDGTETDRIPRNVSKVIDIVGTVPYAFRRPDRYTEKNLQNRSTIVRYYEMNCSHLEVPEQARSIIKTEILESLGK